MGRPETDIDPGKGPIQRFAYGLRKLRQEAGGITYRQMARQVEYSVSTLSRAAVGEQLPSLAVVLAYVRACGGDESEWEARWHATAREESKRAAEEEEATDAPYRGLARFEPADEHLFHGRVDLTDDLDDLAHRHRVTVVFGPSGSGKSSLLRAGLIPRLRRTTDPSLRPAAVRIFTPGPHPARTHGGALAPTEGAGDTWLIVDQFEEVFTLCHDLKEREEFVTGLLAAQDPGSRLRVVLGVRADFYARFLEHGELAEAVRTASLPVGPMTPAELREAVVKPAAAHGLIVERTLTARLLDEVGHEPGGLPLLSHVLLETWRRRRARTLTLVGYEATGGLRGAIAQSAEDAYRRLTLAQARTARRVLLRLITPGEGAPDTRRPTPRGELDTGAPGDAAAVLDALARARLITLDDEVVDLAHEALIAAWPRLSHWIEESRERLVVHRRLTEATAAWEALDRDPGALYRGMRLSVAEERLGTTDEDRTGTPSTCSTGEPVPQARANPTTDGRTRTEESARTDELTPTERDFLTASIAAREDERRAATRRHRAMRLLAASLAVLLVVVTGITLYAVDERQDALRERRLALSRQLAAQAMRLAPSQPALAKLLSMEAYRTAATPQARGTLLTMAAYEYHQGELTGHTDAVSEVAFAPDGRTLVSVSRDRRILLWDARRQVRRATLDGHRTWLRAVAFSPDGRTLASAGDDGDVVLWDTATQRRTATLTGHTAPIKGLAFSPDGRTLASAGVEVRRCCGARTPTPRRSGCAPPSPATSPTRNGPASSPDSRTTAPAHDGGITHKKERSSCTYVTYVTHSAVRRTACEPRSRPQPPPRRPSWSQRRPAQRRRSLPHAPKRSPRWAPARSAATSAATYTTATTGTPCSSPTTGRAATTGPAGASSNPASTGRT
ncbi:helix-turn-helix domain-containing protein [Streptomyces sp. NPDC048483]|uniref:nSTAND1 domain-containing NTPase n=1 Tax=Streptomyces sp. NPDC048483 TaxID=3154927 RepID=UPI00343C7603